MNRAQYLGFTWRLSCISPPSGIELTPLAARHRLRVCGLCTLRCSHFFESLRSSRFGYDSGVHLRSSLHPHTYFRIPESVSFHHFVEAFVG